MLPYGGPVLAGKVKNLPPEQERVQIDDMKLILLQQRMKFQDFPMLVLLISHCITHAATLEPKLKSNGNRGLAQTAGANGTTSLLAIVDLEPLKELLAVLV